MKLIAIREALRDRLREMISDGLTTGVEIAKHCGVAQAHVSNFLNGQRGASFEFSDCLLTFAELEVEDLIPEKELCGRRAFPSDIREHFATVPVVSPDVSGLVHIQQRHARAILLVSDQLVAPLSSKHGRMHWQRLIAVEISSGQILIIDRHDVEGDIGQYAVKVDKKIRVGRLFSIGNKVFCRPDDASEPVVTANHVIGRVVQIQKTIGA